MANWKKKRSRPV